MSSWATARWWLLTRVLAFSVLLAFEVQRKYNVTHDVHYFGHGLGHLPAHGFAHTLVEYPLPGVLLLLVPWLASHVVSFPHEYAAAFALSALAFDAAFTGVLVQQRAHRTALIGWIVGVPLLGAMSYFRFDLVPATLVGLAVLVLAVRPRLALVAVAVATAVKFWPALMIVPVVAGVRGRWRALGLVAAIGAVIAAGTVALGGWARLVSPLTYEAHRGLQVEAVWASPAMLAWGFGPARWHVDFSRYKAFEVTGYGVPGLLTASTVSGVVLVAALAVLWWRLLRHHAVATPEQVAWVSLAGVAGFVVFGKVLSPQYLLWLLAIAVAGLAVTNGARAFRTWAGVLLVAIGLTHLIFPRLYTGLTLHDGTTPYAVPLLALRNLLLLWLLGSAVVHAWRVTRTGPAAVA